jgi:N-acetylmuramic acid 6-phosphate etherase
MPKSEISKLESETLLGIETGGTKTIVITATPSLAQLDRFELGPANLRLISDKDFLALLRELKNKIPKPAAIGIGLPGVRTEADITRVKNLLAKAWPNVPSQVTHDLDLVIHAAELDEPAHKHLAKVVILSGTGSCCFGRSAAGHTAKIGGWGHILGDKASGYDIAVHAARAAVYYFDRDNEWTKLGESILRHTCLNEPNDLITWIQSAHKKEIASAAISVFDAWHKRDRHAAEIIEAAAHSLATDALKCASRLENSDATIQFILAGSVLLKQPKFADLVASTIRAKRPQSLITPLTREAAWGAVSLAISNRQSSIVNRQSASPKLPASQIFNPSSTSCTSYSSLTSLTKSPTEQRNPRSRHLDKLSPRAAINLFLNEEKFIHTALKKSAAKIERALNLVTAALKRNGRLFYVGAGTSGRLGILDASECPPTFRTDPELVQGIIAGGRPAIFRAVEGAEDDPAAGARAIAFRNITARDVVIGIAASGRTPFVWGALAEAKKRRAKTILLTFNPHLQLPKKTKLDLLLAIDVGPELLTGSTRLKSGTATKLVLNILTTLTMVRLGKVASNLMIDLNPSNTKLRDRAIRIVQEITGASREDSETALQKSNWIIKAALKAITLKRQDSSASSRHRKRHSRRSTAEI